MAQSKFISGWCTMRLFMSNQRTKGPGYVSDQFVILLGSSYDYLWMSGAAFFLLSIYNRAVIGLWCCLYYLLFDIVTSLSMLWHRQCYPFEPSPHSRTGMEYQWTDPHLQLQWWALICLEQPSDWFRDGHCRWRCLEIDTEICMQESQWGRLTGGMLTERELQRSSGESWPAVRL